MKNLPDNDKKLILTSMRFTMQERGLLKKLESGEIDILTYLKVTREQVKILLAYKLNIDPPDGLSPELKTTDIKHTEL